MVTKTYLLSKFENSFGSQYYEQQMKSDNRQVLAISTEKATLKG